MWRNQDTTMKDKHTFAEEVFQIATCKNIEIEFIVVSRGFLNGKLGTDERYKVAEREQYKNTIRYEGFTLEFVGYWEEFKLFQNKKGTFESKYEFKTKKLFEICSECLNEEFYDEKRQQYYCPHCLEERPWKYRLTEFKEKAKNYLPERIK